MTVLAENTVVDGRYRLLSVLGSGGMADVWCAEDSQLGRRVALKILHSRFAQDREFVQRFRLEAEAAARLQHPNIVGVFDRGEFEGTNYIAMEYVEGSSLRELISRGLDTGQAVELTRQILTAARYAHEHGIVHRDLKPLNVLVDADGRARVTDFGIARAGASDITQAGSVLGTAQYLSPEQAQGMPVTPASDLYSIGVILYEMLTGRVPFEAESAVAVAMKQVSEQPMPPSAINPHVPRSLDAVVLRALAKQPENRFASADELRSALDAAERDPAGAISDTTAYAPFGAPGGPGDGTGEEPEPAPGRRRRLILAALGAILLGGVLALLAIRLLGADPVTVPGVVGQQVEGATRTLERAGFEVVVDRDANDAPEGTVLEQDPRGGTEADEGSEVVLAVSAGPGAATVPDVQGMPVRRATQRLDAAGFMVRDRERFSRRVGPGRAIRTEPPAGTELVRGETVTLFVSKGENLVEVPSTIGQTRSAAQAALRDAGLLPNVETESSQAPEGEVFEQFPDPGSSVTRGDEVTIVVSEGPGTVTVPEVIDRRVDAAVSRLNGRGLDVRIEEVETEVRREDDRVLDQFPGGGAEIDPGSEVTIRVGLFVEPAGPDAELEGPPGGRGQGPPEGP